MPFERTRIEEHFYNNMKGLELDPFKIVFVLQISENVMAIRYVLTLSACFSDINVDVYLYWC